MNLLDLSKDVLSAIFSPESIGRVGCTVVSHVCKEFAEIVQDDVLHPEDHRNKPCKYAADHGYLNVIKWLHSQGFRVDTGVCKHAAAHNQQELIEWIKEMGIQPDNRSTEAAAKHGHLDMLKWLHETGCPWNSRACSTAAKYGQFDVLKWLFAENCPHNMIVYEKTARSGNTDILHWLMENFPADNNDRLNAKISHYATKFNHHKMILALRSYGFYFDAKNCLIAMVCCNLGILKTYFEVVHNSDKQIPGKSPTDMNKVRTLWRQFMPELCDAAMYAAEKQNRLDIIKLIDDYGYIKCTAPIICNAAHHGHLEIVQWMKPEDKSRIDEYTWFAARHGHVHVLKWLLENGAKLYPDLCRGAARTGSIKMLNWLREMGCPWDAGTCSEAASKGHLKLIKWAVKNGCPFDEESCELASRYGHLETLKWLVRIGCPINNQSYRQASIQGHLDVIKWITANTTNIHWDIAASAAEYGHYDTVVWAMENKHYHLSSDKIYEIAETARHKLLDTFDAFEHHCCYFLNSHAKYQEYHLIDEYLLAYQSSYSDASEDDDSGSSTSSD